MGLAPRYLVVGAALVALAAATSACGSSQGGSGSGGSGAASPATSASAVSVGNLSGIPSSSEMATPTASGADWNVPVGGSNYASIPKNGKLNIAFFDIGSSTAWMVAQNNAVAEQARKAGFRVTEFDGNENPQTQFQQVQEALNSKKYGAFIVDAVDGSLECKLFTTNAAAAHIPVIVLTNPLCGRAEGNGIDAWAPGSTTFVGGNDLEAFNEQYFEHIAQENPNAKVGFLTGPLLNGATVTTEAAIKATEQKYPKFDVVATYNTDFTSATGLQDTQTLLSAHPDVNTIISIYTGITEGAVSALRSAGKVGKVKLYGEGGDTTDIEAIKSGILTMTVPLYPASTGAAAVNELALLVQGKAVPRYLGNDGSPLSNLVSVGSDMLYIDKSNVADYTPQF